MRKSYRYLAASLLALLVYVTASAQAVTVSGTVRNSDSKEQIVAVSVSVKGTNLGTYTNSNGEFSIRVAALPVTLVFSSVGFAAQEVNVSDASKAVAIEFVAVPIIGQDVVLAASRTPQRILESPVTIERMGGATLRNMSAPSYYEGITNLKGVDMHTASITFRTVTTRGFVASGNTRLNQLIDGMDNQAPGLNFSVGSVVGITDLDVDNIEVLSGASSALYGSGGINGTILLTSRNPFKYQGLSYNIKQGIMHVDGKNRKASPYVNWCGRWAKAWNNKFAVKLALELVKANDWMANDYRNKQQIGVLSKVVGGNAQNDPNFNGINIYGDETSLELRTLLLTLWTANGSPAAMPGVNPTNGAQILVPTSYFLDPNNFPVGSVSRTGYEEKALVDYNALNFKGTVGLHWKITPNIEASWTSYLGTGTTVYTGADRYSLKNLKIAQHKLEVRAKNWFLRGYTTQENSGDSYIVGVTGQLLNEVWKRSFNPASAATVAASWYPQYMSAYMGYKYYMYLNNPYASSEVQAHLFGRTVADIGRLLPGSAAFETAAKTVRTTPIKNGGSKFLDKSDLWAAEGQFNASDALGFTNVVEMIGGIQWKQWLLKSQGTLFADTLGEAIKVTEFGGYIQLRKKLFNDVVTLTGAIRYDKQTNFDGRWTPRFTATFRVAKDNNIRLSYQTAYRFPTNQDQYISLKTGAGTLIGSLPEFQTYYKLNSTMPGYTPASILAYRASGNPANTNLLVRGTYTPVVPETVSSYEIGYRGILHKNFLIDAYGYYSRYKNFLARYALGQGNPSTFSPFSTINISYIQNLSEEVKAYGWGVSIDYNFTKNYWIYGNVFSDMLSDLPDNFVSFFNAPKYRWNLGLRCDNVVKNIGFNVVVKWQDNNYYEGTFVTGTLPYFAWADAQVSYRPAGTKSTFRVGATNLANHYARTGFGSPYVGGLYYLSYGYNIF